MPEIERKLRQFIVDNFLFGDKESTFSNDDSFLEREIIDSTGILELVAFLEEKFEIKIKDNELVPENLDSISCLVRFIDRKSRATT
jgi:acyl carrier protein